VTIVLGSLLCGQAPPLRGRDRVLQAQYAQQGPFELNSEPPDGSIGWISRLSGQPPKKATIAF
jgi:hypothetical protein